MNKHKFAILIIISTVIIASLTTVVIYNLTRIKETPLLESETKMINKVETYATANIIENKETIETNVSEEKISPNASIIFEKYYKGCSHTIRVRENVTEKMVNMNEDEFKKLYSDWKIIKFDSNEIELYKEFAGECNEHYLVKENNGFVSIYKINGNGDIKLLKNTEISTSYLSEADVKNLQEGVKLVGKEELNAYLENFE